MLKRTTEHARYRFSFLGSSPRNADRIDAAYNQRDHSRSGQSTHEKEVRRSGSDNEVIAERLPDPDRKLDLLNQQLSAAQMEIEKLRADLSHVKHPVESQGPSPSRQKRSGQVPEVSSSSSSSSGGQPACLIDYSALQDMVKCSICQLTLLDAVVCKYDMYWYIYLR
jgi:hypothetical protein